MLHERSRPTVSQQIRLKNALAFSTLQRRSVLTFSLIVFYLYETLLIIESKPVTVQKQIGPCIGQIEKQIGQITLIARWSLIVLVLQK